MKAVERSYLTGWFLDVSPEEFDFFNDLFHKSGGASGEIVERIQLIGATGMTSVYVKLRKVVPPA